MCVGLSGVLSYQVCVSYRLSGVCWVMCVLGYQVCVGLSLSVCSMCWGYRICWVILSDVCVNLGC